MAIARTCQYLVDLDLSNCHIINTGSFGILSKLTSLQVSISCSINVPSSLSFSHFSFYSEIDPSLPWGCPKGNQWLLQGFLKVAQNLTQAYLKVAPILLWDLAFAMSLLRKCFKNWSFQKISITKNMPLNWYFSMKKNRNIRIIFDIENCLWKSEIGIFWSLNL